MSELTKGYIGKEDIKQYEGSSTTFSRKTSTGGTANINIFDEHVDAYMVGGKVLTSACINYVLDIIGSNNCTLYIKTGAWVIDADITIPTNVNIKVPLGAKMTIAAGITVTINGGILAGHYEIFAGTGTVTGTVINAFIDSVWSNAATTDTLAITADSSSITIQDLSIADLTVSGTVSAEQLTSTDDATIAGDLTVGGNATVTGTVSAEQLTSTDDATIAGDLAVTGEVDAGTLAIASTVVAATAAEINTGCDGIANPPIAGDSTAGRVLRAAQVTITDGTTADTIGITLYDAIMFNSVALALVNNLAKNTTSGGYSLSGDGTGLTIASANLGGGDVVGVIGAYCMISTYFDDVYPYVAISSGDLVVGVSVQKAASRSDLTAIGSGKALTLNISFIAES